MSASFTCDGCGSSVDVPTTIGHILKRDYCVECASAAKKFVALEEALRKEMHARFVADRDTLIRQFFEVKGRLTSFKLPDVP